MSPPRLAQLPSCCCCYVVWCATVLQHTRVVVRRGPAATNPVFALSFGFPHLDWMTTVVVTDMRFASRVASNSDSHHCCSLCNVHTSPQVQLLLFPAGRITELNKDNKKKWQDLKKGLCTWAFLFVCNKVQMKMKMHRDLLCGS